MKKAMTDIHGIPEDNLRSFKFEVSKEKNVARERHALLTKEFSTLKELINLKIK